MLDLNLYCSGLEVDSEGIWCATEQATVSYPDNGHDACLTVEDGSFWFKHRNHCIAALVRNHPPQHGSPIFDVGGGNGFVARGLADAGFEVVLVEPGRQGASNAKRRGVNHVVCATTETARLAAASLPAVGLFDVIEHIKDDGAFVRQIASLMRPGGRLYATVPAHRWLWSQEDDFAGHFHRYTLGSFCTLLGSAGMKIDYASYFFKWLPLPIAMLRALPYRLGVSRSPPSQATAACDHRPEPGRLSRVLAQLLESERACVEAGRPIAFGASCLVAARRT